MRNKSTQICRTDFADAVIVALESAKILGVRAGAEHRYTGVWVMVLERRVFIRSSNDKPTGWFHAFKMQPRGAVQIGGLEIHVRGKVVRSARIREAVTLAFGEKYNTNASRKWAKGFARPARILTTLEFVPA